CGKTTLVKTILGILPANAHVSNGRIALEGRDLLVLGETELAHLRGGALGFIPQDPFLSFNPMFTVGTQLLEILRWHAPPDFASKTARRARLIEILQAVQIAEPEAALARYPHQFSGGQRQRLMIAGALLCKPRLIVADEPTSALDVTTQQQILVLLRRLARDFDVAVLLVTHDFGIVAETCDRVTVMYAGQSVETGAALRLISTPLHPYTRLLIACHPDRNGALGGIPGSVPPPSAMPSGCRFNARCPQARPRCVTALPAPVERDRRDIRCILYAAESATGAGDAG
ncbi:MAG TPA: ABC transporter ATP-binding protein, partial [Beijerinckiaceae bacterium]|nr:ABC transporter ATP-binding protein [Beijerinckiaceae bacterium]